MTRDPRTTADRSRPRPPCVPVGTRVYAIGDSHGCCARLRALHRLILDDAAADRADRRVVVYLGDYVDRGPDSRDLLDLLVASPLAGFETIHLLGNHDAMMRDFLDGAGDFLLWVSNGGEATLRSYGVAIDALLAVTSPLAVLRRALSDRVPAAHRHFLGGLRLHHTEGDYLFVHAGIRPGRPLEAQGADDLLWIREPFLSWRGDHGKVVVHGHTPVPRPEVHGNRIAIDTGACFGGPLTALVLEGDRRRFLQA